MYAIIKTGGKQYRVSKGEKLKLEKLDAEIGKKVVFNEVLSVGEGADLKIGTPYIKDAKVEAKVLDEGKSKKIEVIKFKRRKIKSKHLEGLTWHIRKQAEVPETEETQSPKDSD